MNSRTSFLTEAVVTAGGKTTGRLRSGRVGALFRACSERSSRNEYHACARCRRLCRRGNQEGGTPSERNYGSMAVIVALHIATGAAAGAATGSRTAALLIGPVLHLAGDRMPHQDFRSRRFEIGSGLAGLLLLAARRGPFDPATLGAAASAAPDLEHVLPVLRPGGRKLFHDRLGWHRSGRFPAFLQLALAGGIIAALARR